MDPIITVTYTLLYVVDSFSIVVDITCHLSVLLTAPVFLLFTKEQLEMEMDKRNQAEDTDLAMGAEGTSELFCIGG